MAANCPAPGAAQQPDETAQPSQNAESSTIVYGPEFFAQYPNAVSILDIIERIPAGRLLLGTTGVAQARGVSTNDDQILINGKRLSGKTNDSRDVLGRITVDQVARIEIIRGTSPDIKISNQELLINIVLKEGDAAGGSGSTRACPASAISARAVRFVPPWMPVCGWTASA